MDRSAGSELLSMMALVAAVVAIVILVFFGVGYLFGRLFLEIRAFAEGPNRIGRPDGEYTARSPSPEKGVNPWH